MFVAESSICAVAMDDDSDDLPSGVGVGVGWVWGGCGCGWVGVGEWVGGWVWVSGWVGGWVGVDGKESKWKTHTHSHPHPHAHPHPHPHTLVRRCDESTYRTTGMKSSNTTSEKKHTIYSISFSLAKSLDRCLTCHRLTRTMRSTSGIARIHSAYTIRTRKTRRALRGHTWILDEVVMRTMEVHAFATSTLN